MKYTIKYTENEIMNICTVARQLASLYKEKRKQITSDDILNLRITLETTNDVTQFINSI